VKSTSVAHAPVGALTAKWVGVLTPHRSIVLFDSKIIKEIEIPAPKTDVFYKEGFEHIEVVTKKNLGDSFLKSGYVKFHKQPLSQIIKNELSENKIKNKNKMVIFDLDGTISDTTLDFAIMLQDTLQQILGRQISENEMKNLIFPTFTEVLISFGINNFEMRQKFYNIFPEIWIKKALNSKFILGAETLLSTLWHEGYKLYLWTARDSISVQHTIENYKLQYYFSGIFSSSASISGKPVPCLELKKIVSDADKCLLIGDSNSDERGAENLGISFVYFGNKSLENTFNDIFKTIEKNL
jgi:phosphoglycolate phosphatase